MLKSMMLTLAILVGSGFFYLMGYVSMTGIDLSIMTNLIEFWVFHGFVLICVIVALKQVW